MEIVSRKKIVSLTSQECAHLCCGCDTWHTNRIDRVGIPALMLCDGPNGLRKQETHCDHLGANGSLPATCFPTMGAAAAAWDAELMYELGRAIGEECRAMDVSVLLGPAINIRRGPLGGRNFEYLAEDPCLCGALATAYVNGVQSTGTGAALKHFAVNNQETNRMSLNAEIDERTLREIYLPGFEMCIKGAQPWMVMCAYNKVNGISCCDNHWLLTELLRNEWGFKGAVVSDWGAVNYRADGVRAGLDLEMPGSFGNGEKSICHALENGMLSEACLRQSSERILSLVEKCSSAKAADDTDLFVRNHALAQRAAEESIVLLKNGGNLLPLNHRHSIAVIGAYAEAPLYQGGGSSRLCPTRLDSPLEELKKLAGNDTRILYAEGYQTDPEDDGFFVLGEHFASVTNIPDKTRIREAADTAAQAETAVVFAGLPGSYQCESFDRVDLHLPKGQEALIRAVSAANPNTVVVLLCGSPVEMPWLRHVCSVVYCGFAGQGVGQAVARILWGAVCPSGKLTESFPVKIQDTPCFLDFPGGHDTVSYREGVFVGYRYYDAKQISPLFPFGHGLSYTSFRYENMRITVPASTDDVLDVSVEVRNIGSAAGREIVQLYVGSPARAVVRPQKELKAFAKTKLLLPGESEELYFTLDQRAFAYYDTEKHSWRCENGTHHILLGSSSRDIRCKKTIDLVLSDEAPTYDWNSILSELRKNPIASAFLDKHMKSSEENLRAFFENSPLKVSVNMGDLLSLEDAETLLDMLNKGEQL